MTQCFRITQNVYFIFTETELFKLNRLLPQSCAYVLWNKLIKLYYNFILWVQLLWITSYISHWCLPSHNGPLGVIKSISGKSALSLSLLNDSRKFWTNMFDTLTTTVLPDRNRSNQPLTALSCVSSTPRFWQFLSPSLHHLACDRQSFYMCLSDKM